MTLKKLLEKMNLKAERRNSRVLGRGQSMQNYILINRTPGLKEGPFRSSGFYADGTKNSASMLSPKDIN